MKKKQNTDITASNLLHSTRISRSKTISTPRKKKSKCYKTVEDIWLGILNEEIDITYAVIGYVYSNGIPIFSSDDMTTLLLHKGCSMDLIMDFLVDFSKVHEKNPETPVLMMTSNKLKMYKEFFAK